MLCNNVKIVYYNVIARNIFSYVYARQATSLDCKKHGQGKFVCSTCLSMKMNESFCLAIPCFHAKQPSILAR